MPGYLVAGSNTALNAVAAAYTWVKLHIGDPGSAGTANPAVETRRMQVSWTTSTANLIESSAAVSLTSVAASEDYTHYTVMSASTAGTAGFSGTITANPVVAGDTITFGAGTFDTSHTLAA